MTGRTHEAIGVATALGVCALTGPTPMQGAVLVGCSFATSRLPDRLEFGVLPHRGPTHWLLTAGLVIVVLTLAASLTVDTRPFAGTVMAGVACGYLMHLAADCCTVSGVPLYGPFSGRDRHLLPRGHRFVTGKAGDKLLAFLCVAASIGLGVVMFPAA